MFLLRSVVLRGFGWRKLIWKSLSLRAEIFQFAVKPAFQKKPDCRRCFIAFDEGERILNMSKSVTRVSVDAIQVHILTAMLGHLSMYLEHFTSISCEFKWRRVALRMSMCESNALNRSVINSSSKTFTAFLPTHRRFNCWNLSSKHFWPSTKLKRVIVKRKKNW